MVVDLKKAFGNRIDSLAWMSPATKARAKEKLATLIIGVGYPDRWQDYLSLQIIKGDALGNLRRADLFKYQRQLLTGSKRVNWCHRKCQKPQKSWIFHVFLLPNTIVSVHLSYGRL